MRGAESESTGGPLRLSTEFALAVLEGPNDWAEQRLRARSGELGVVVGRCNNLGCIVRVREPKALDILRNLADEIALKELLPAVEGPGEPAFAESLAIAKLRPEVRLKDFQQFMEQQGAQLVDQRTVGRARYVFVQARNVPAANSLSARIQAEGWSVFAEPNLRMTVRAAQHPNDPKHDEPNRRAFELIGLPDAWELEDGESDVAVAVFDMGYDLGHPDLQQNVAFPYDAVADDTNPEPEYSDDNHGTPVVGIIGATTNNALGGPGIAPGVKVVPVKIGVSTPCFGGPGDCIAVNGDTLVRAAAWITGLHSVQVAAVSNSWGLTEAGGLTPEMVFADLAIEARGGRGTCIVGATGNQSRELSLSTRFSQVLFVGAVSSLGRWEPYSNYGPLVDIVAPGTLWTTDRRGSAGYDTGGDYTEFRGTSTSTPIVAGIAGLVLSADKDLSGEDVCRILLHSAGDLEAYQDPQEWAPATHLIVGIKHARVGFGVINAVNAVTMASSRKQIPRTVHPILYWRGPWPASVPFISYLRKDPGAENDPKPVTWVLPQPRLLGERVVVQLRVAGRDFIYRASPSREVIQTLDPVDGIGETVYESAIEQAPETGGFYDDASPVLIRSFPDGREVASRLDYDAASNSMELTVVHEYTLRSDNTRSYHYLASETNPRLLRFARRREPTLDPTRACVLDFVELGPDGVPGPPTLTHDFESAEFGTLYRCPLFLTVYEGDHGFFLVTGPTYGDYSIRIAHLDPVAGLGTGLSQEHGRGSRLAIATVYEQGKPKFIFWGDSGELWIQNMLAPPLELVPAFASKGDYYSPFRGRDWQSTTLLHFE